MLKPKESKSITLPKKHILVITSHYFPDYGPSAPIFSWLCEDLVKLGYAVTVITGIPHYSKEVLDTNNYKKRINQETRFGVNLLRIRVITVPKNSLWMRLMYHISFNINSTIAAFRVKNPDIIIADAPTLWSGLPLLFKGILAHVPFIYIVFDIYPDVLEKLGYLKSSLMSLIFRSVEKFYYRMSQWITVISNGFKNNLLSLGVKPEKIRIIPICVDVDFFQPNDENNQYRSLWNLDDKFVILYAGNIGLSQGLNIVVDAAEILLGHPLIHIVIVGEGASLNSLKEKANFKGLSNIQFHDFLPFEEIPKMYSAADICLISMKPELIIESVPSKTYTIMASGKPVIATVDSQSEVGILLRSAQCGICVPPGNSKALATAIIQLSQDKQKCSQMAKNGRSYVVKNNSRYVFSNGYKYLIDSCLNQQKKSDH
jgi:colanic acid biosynthesis glycosyl transferase WcaI